MSETERQLNEEVERIKADYAVSPIAWAARGIGDLLGYCHARYGASLFMSSGLAADLSLAKDALRRAWETERGLRESDGKREQL